MFRVFEDGAVGKVVRMVKRREEEGITQMEALLPLTDLGDNGQRIFGRSVVEEEFRLRACLGMLF